MRWRIALLLLAVSLGGTTVQAQPALFSDLVVFGDSLSDNGNLFAIVGFPPSPPYFEGRFSNGPVWSEVLADNLGANTYANLAIGGSTAALMLELQVLPYVSAVGVDPEALYVVWAGANDLLDVMEGGVDPDTGIENAMANIAIALDLLAAGGAQNLVVPGVPDLGRTPRFLSAGADVAATATALSVAFNDALADVIDAVEVDHDLDLIEPNALGLLSTLSSQPHRFGLEVVTEPALAPDFTVVAEPDEYLYWDDIHPTRVAHRITGELWTELIATHLMLASVVELRSSGQLSPGRAIALRAKLLGARVRIAHVAIRPAATRIRAVGHQTSAFVRTGVLTAADAAVLLGGAAITAHLAKW